MRLFLLWPDKIFPKKLIKRLSDESCQIVYWVGSKGGGEEDFPEIIFHDHYDAWDGRPAPALNFDGKFDPPSPELISRHHNIESLVLTMMNKHFDWMGVDERKHLYYKMLAYWSRVLEILHPDGIVLTTVPHTVYDYILYELARSKNIKTLMFRGTLPVTGRLVFYEDFKVGCVPLTAQVEKNKNKKFSPSDLSKEWREFYEKQTSLFKSDNTPIYLKDNYRRFSFLNRLKLKAKAIINSFKKKTFFEQSLYWIIKLFKENARQEYKRFQSPPDYNRKFIYVPLAYQPESSTAPLGDVFIDQILMIETLSTSLPDGWRIYVKEHPTQWFKRGVNFAGSRYRGYYEKISKIKDTYLIPVTADTYSLIHSAQAVVTTSGVAGIEAVLRQKPVLSFGYPWYRDCPGVFKVEDVKTCREVFRQIEGGFSVNPEATLSFLKSVDQVAIRGWIDGYQQKTSEVSESESLNSILDAILNIFRKK